MKTAFSPTMPAKQLNDLATQLGARVHIDVTIPRTTVHGRMRLALRSEISALRAEAHAHFASLGRPVTAATLVEPDVIADWNAEIASRHLAVAVRDPSDESKPLGDLATWRGCDDDQINALWVEYQDLAERLDPLGETAAGLTEEEVTALRAAAKKADAPALRSFGSWRLALFAISSAAQPAT